MLDISQDVCEAALAQAYGRTISRIDGQLPVARDKWERSGSTTPALPVSVEFALS
jgi:hypothetical protein